MKLRIISASERNKLSSAARLVSEQRQQSHSIAVTGKQHFEIQSLAQKAIPWFKVMFLRIAEKCFEEIGGPLYKRWGRRNFHYKGPRKREDNREKVQTWQPKLKQCYSLKPEDQMCQMWSLPARSPHTAVPQCRTVPGMEHRPAPPGAGLALSSTGTPRACSHGLAVR